MTTVAALTLGQSTPSARFRVRQFIEPLAKLGIHVVEQYPALGMYGTPSGSRVTRAVKVAGRLARSAATRLPQVARTWTSDLTWLSKQLVPGVPSWEPLLHRPLVLDVDDAMWLARPLGVPAARAAARSARAVTAGNRYLADWYGQYNGNVHVVPTSIDVERFRPAETRPVDPFVLGWSGSRATLPYLESLEAPLGRFLASVPDARLLVISDAAPRFGGALASRVDFLPWSPEAEVTGLARMSVGIMPLPDDAISRGKCSFKMLQYMACGLPVIVSPVGSNAEILGLSDVGCGATTVDEWVEALRECRDNEHDATARGSRGRALVEREFSVTVSAIKLANVFRELAG